MAWRGDLSRQPDRHAGGRSLPDRRRGRPRRHVHRLPGAGHPAGPGRSDQGDEPALRHRPVLPDPLRTRGQDRRRPGSLRRGRGVRLRPRRRPCLPGDGAGGRRHLARFAPPVRAALRAGHPGGAGTAAGRAGNRPRGGVGAPGHQAGEHLDLGQRRAQDRRLRAGPGGRCAVGGHRQRHPGHRCVPVPRAGLDGRRGRPLGRVRRRGTGLGDAHRPAALRRRQPDGGGLPARALRHPAGYRAGPRRAGRAGGTDRRGHPTRPGRPAPGTRRPSCPRWSACGRTWGCPRSPYRFLPPDRSHRRPGPTGPP